MKHLKTFEYFDFENNQEEEEFLMDDPFAGEEEEEGRFEFEEEEGEEEYPESEGMPDTFGEEEEEEVYDPSKEQDLPQPYRQIHGHGQPHISSFKSYHESTCPSCNCAECECGGGKMAYEAKKADKMTKKEKELAAKYPPKDKITRGDIITAAKENADKKGGKEDKKSEKSPKGKLSKAQEKLPPALKKAIASGVRD